MTELATTNNGQAKTPVAVGVPLRGLDDAWRLSQNLALANLLPKDLRGKPSDVLAIVLYGQELGLAPMQSIQGIYVVNGRPTLAAQTWLALLRREGHRAEVIEHTDTLCRVKLTRGDTGETHTETFTIQDAQRAGLANKDVWKAHPRRMTLSRAVSNACRFLCPEIALGFYGEGEEFTDDTPASAITQVEAPMQDVQDAVVVEPEQARAEIEQIAAQFGADPLQPTDKELAERAGA